jgi:hypothetical protein
MFTFSSVTERQLNIQHSFYTIHSCYSTYVRSHTSVTRTSNIRSTPFMLFNVSQVIHTGYVTSVSALAAMETPEWSDLVADTPRASLSLLLKYYGTNKISGNSNRFTSVSPDQRSSYFHKTISTCPQMVHLILY